MAKVVGPLHSFEASGKIGPLVFARNRGGQYARSWYLPVNPKSFSQTLFRRQTWSNAVLLWIGLADTFRKQWYEFAENYYAGPRSKKRNAVNAENLFLQIQVRASYLGFGEQHVPPLVPVPDFFPSFSLVWTVNGAELSWQPVIPSGCYIIVYQQRCLYASAIAPRPGQRSHVFSSTDASPQLLTPPCGNGGGPGNQPPFNCNSYLQFHVYALDSLFRKSVPQFFRLKAGF